MQSRQFHVSISNFVSFSRLWLSPMPGASATIVRSVDYLIFVIDQKHFNFFPTRNEKRPILTLSLTNHLIDVCACVRVCLCMETSAHQISFLSLVPILWWCNNFCTSFGIIYFICTKRSICVDCVRCKKQHK